MNPSNQTYNLIAFANHRRTAAAWLRAHRMEFHFSTPSRARAAIALREYRETKALSNTLLAIYRHAEAARRINEQAEPPAAPARKRRPDLEKILTLAA